MFRARLDAIIDPRHDLVRLACVIDWNGLADALSQYYCLADGRSDEPIRLMAGLILLKETKGLSDEELCATWREKSISRILAARKATK